MIRSILALAVLAASVSTTISAHAAVVTSDFANVTAASAAQFALTGWFTDRYEPTSFSNVGAYQGRSNVLGIGISDANNAAKRLSGQQGSFYNTQGRQHNISGGAGSSIAADLFIEEGWRNGQSGNVRSDLWGVMSSGPASPGVFSNISGYPIIGFTNYGGAARYRVYDDEAGGWQDLVTAVNYGGWTAFEIKFTGTSFDFYVDGTQVYTDNTIDGTTGFRATIMQAYNFGDPTNPNLVGAVEAPYTAHWSNAQAVPEPTSVALFGLALAGLAAMRRRKS